MTVSFTKMHGAGNDFVVLDAREEALRLHEGWQAQIADRRFGVGCDQIVVLENSQMVVNDALPHLFMRIYNGDGSESGACGNATRCVAWRLMEETMSDACIIETVSGHLQCWRAGDHQVKVDMGPPKLEWQQIPLSEQRNTSHLGIAGGKQLLDPVAVNMGNPHAVFFVNHVEDVDLAKWGPILEHDAVFPERANISAAQVVSPEHIKLRVWERGTGLTLACGTAACATLVAGVMRGLSERRATITLPGGDLLIEWEDTQTDEIGHIFKTGPVKEVFTGVLS